MEKVIYLCDLCGEVIQGATYQTGTPCITLWDGDKQDSEDDVCYDCYNKIKELVESLRTVEKEGEEE